MDKAGLEARLRDALGSTTMTHERWEALLGVVGEEVARAARVKTVRSETRPVPTFEGDGDGDRVCGAFSPDRRACNLRPGHDGDHVAFQPLTVLAKWPRSVEAEVRVRLDGLPAYQSALRVVEAARRLVVNRHRYVGSEWVPLKDALDACTAEPGEWKTPEEWWPEKMGWYFADAECHMYTPTLAWREDGEMLLGEEFGFCSRGDAPPGLRIFTTPIWEPEEPREGE